MQIPILLKHEHDKQIGVLREENGGLFVEFQSDVYITQEWLFEIFGGAGIRIIEMHEKDGVFYIRKGQILEFSLSL